MKKRIMAILMCFVMMLGAVGCSEKTTQKKTDDAVPGMDITDENEEEVDLGGDIDGIVINAQADNLILQTTQGITYGLTNLESADLSKLSTKLELGVAVHVLYDDDNGVPILRTIEDSQKKPKVDAQALEAMGKIILTVMDSQLSDLSEYCEYPVYVGLGDGTIVESADEFEQLDADSIFTDELVAAIKGIKPFELEDTQAGIVLGDGKPNIIIGKTDGVWRITGINY